MKYIGWVDWKYKGYDMKYIGWVDWKYKGYDMKYIGWVLDSQEKGFL